ncbi:MAG: penicillin-insensitive murein endopeptidase [Acetobacteraceae bacterium]|nr:penicillin-insensitive murein endopeptidase [Acetobacteraceae bacterium]
MTRTRDMLRRSLLSALLAVALGAAAGLEAEEGPAPGPVRVIGSNASGCIAGAVQLPAQGPGFQEIRISRSTFWGHPRTVADIELLAREAKEAGLPDLYINDIAAPRGGPIASHAGHQLGLEADIWLDVTPKPVLSPAERDALEPPSVVAPDGRSVDPAIWRPEHATLLRLAAQLPDVDRIFVHPAIKRELCDTAGGDRRWLRLIRPWYGHASHFHIRFRCPAEQPECMGATAPVPPGDGCDATLQWWFDQLGRPAAPAAPPPPPPAACLAIWAAPER